MKHLTADPDVAHLPEPFRSVVRKALHKDSEKRYASVSEMTAALGSPVSGDPRIGAAPTEAAPGPPALFIGGDPAAEVERTPFAGAANPPSASPAEDSTFYITEEGAGDDMVFGPVAEREDCRVIQSPSAIPRDALSAPRGAGRAAAGASNRTAHFRQDPDAHRRRDSDRGVRSHPLADRDHRRLVVLDFYRSALAGQRRRFDPATAPQQRLQAPPAPRVSGEGDSPEALERDDERDDRRDAVLRHGHAA